MCGTFISGINAFLGKNDGLTDMSDWNAFFGDRQRCLEYLTLESNEECMDISASTMYYVDDEKEISAA